MNGTRERSLVLVADDDENILWSMELVLRAAGFDVVKARDGQEALSMACSECPDVALLDVGMPKRTGDEVLEAMRDNQATNGIPVVFVTAYDPDNAFPEGSAASSEKLITKPFRSTDLIGAVEDCLDGA